MGEREYLITEVELNKIFQFVISKPLSEALEAYNILMEVGKRANIDLKSPVMESSEEKVDERNNKSE